MHSCNLNPGNLFLDVKQHPTAHSLEPLKSVFLKSWSHYIIQDPLSKSTMVSHSDTIYILYNENNFIIISFGAYFTNVQKMRNSLLMSSYCVALHRHCISFIPSTSHQDVGQPSAPAFTEEETKYLGGKVKPLAQLCNWWD